jgi:hypothetical protein
VNSYHLQGAVPLSSPAYIERQFENSVFQSVSSGRWILLLGPRQYGKTTGLIRVKAKLESFGFCCAMIDLQSLPPLNSYVQLLEWFSLKISSSLDYANENKPKTIEQDQIEAWLSLSVPKDCNPIVIIVDEASAIKEDLFRDTFYNQIRSIANARAFATPLNICSRVRFIFSGTFHPDKMVKDERNSPFNVCEVVEAKELSIEEALSLQKRVEGIEDKTIIEKIYSLVGGHPYLIQLLLSRSNPEYGNRIELLSESISQLTNGGFNHLGSVFSKVLGEKGLFDIVSAIVRDGQIFNEPANQNYKLLQILGVCKREGSFLIFQNRLYEDYARNSMLLNPKKGWTNTLEQNFHTLTENHDQISENKALLDSEEIPLVLGLEKVPSDLSNSCANNAVLKSNGEGEMTGIPTALMPALRKALMDCAQFSSHDQLYAVFAVNRLRPFQNRLPEAPNKAARTDLTISYLSSKSLINNENALVILLEELSKSYDENDELPKRLKLLAFQLKQHLSRKQAGEEALNEANPNKVEMLHIADAEKMLAQAKAVARIDIPQFLDRKTKGTSTGTAWLITPTLAITCWHVIEARNYLEPAITVEELQNQIENGVLRFDFTAHGEGLQYGIEKLEFPMIDNEHLDFAILKVKDRADYPLKGRGYLRLDMDMPLIPESSPLFIIQHPLGQDQQESGGVFIRQKADDISRILYSSPSEKGTSGSPVFNRINWRVVALHNAESDQSGCREGTLLKSVLSEVKRSEPSLYEEIMATQRGEV